ncbi:MAG: excinuclease ABC subunit UvrA [Bdellovibrionales bacterium]
MKDIHLWGVKQNNLKNLDVKIPLGSFTVVCGPSGSGKSSLAFETLYAEGQRRYIESLSNYARQFLNKAPKPDIEGVENIPPAIAIEQKNYVKTSRSTVGTHTEMLDYLRLLYEKIGEPYCPNCKIPIERSSVTDSTDKTLSLFEGQRGYVLAPILKEVRVAKGTKLLDILLKEGFLRIYHKGKVEEIDTKSKLPADDFFVVVDRMSFNTDDRGRVADSISQAYATGMNLNKGMTGGKAEVITVEGGKLRVSEENACTNCGYVVPQITSTLFNFSNPVGACRTCNGFGNTLEIDVNKVIPDPTRSISQGALQPFTMPSASQDKKELLAFCKKAKIETSVPWEDLPTKHQKAIWEGTKDFFGVKGLFEYLETKKYKMHVRVFLSRYKSPVTCPTCGGTRLRPEAESILIKGKSITKLSQMTIEKLLILLQEIELTKTQKKISQEILLQLISRLQFLAEVGVEYLTIDRPTRTLSGGEYQRIQLANQLGMMLSQTLYVLDEPTVGLHPRDNDRLIGILKKLRDLGNTLVVVEHDAEVIKNSSHVIEMGPGSGHLGGEAIFAGTREEFMRSTKSVTVPYLTPKQWVPPPVTRPVDLEQFRYALELKGAKGHNLKNVDVKIPLRRLTAITGVSGSGKSTLISQTLFPAIARVLSIEFEEAQPFKSLHGDEHLKNVVYIDQRPISRSARSNPLTYLKAYTEIRELMASTEDAKVKNFTAGHFSLNVDGGRCPVCRGEGYETVDMLFMDDVKLICDACDGKRFTKEILDIRYKGKNIDEILNMTVTESMGFFVPHPSIRQRLHILKEVGLDYLRLGQPTSNLSGGESQRLKIARELSESEQRETLYILDEPTTGLHFREVELLMSILNRLIDAGGTVIVIEHNLDVVKACDYVIDLGPEGGEKGGKIIFAGTPQDLANQENSHTGRFLKPIFGLEPQNRKPATKNKSKGVSLV